MSSARYDMIQHVQVNKFCSIDTFGMSTKYLTLWKVIVSGLNGSIIPFFLVIPVPGSPFDPELLLFPAKYIING